MEINVAVSGKENQHANAKYCGDWVTVWSPAEEAYFQLGCGLYIATSCVFFARYTRSSLVNFNATSHQSKNHFGTSGPRCHASVNN